MSKMEKDSSSRLAELKELWIDDEISEMEFEELMDSALDGGPPYYWKRLVSDTRTTSIPTPDEIDEDVYMHRNEYFTIDGNIARVREEEPDWENVVRVYPRGVTPPDS